MYFVLAVLIRFFFFLIVFLRSKDGSHQKLQWYPCHARQDATLLSDRRSH